MTREIVDRRIVAPYGGSNTLMQVNGLSCVLHTPKAWTSAQPGLPECAPRPAFAVDEYVNCPESWVRGSADTSSYFVAVNNGQGLWLDFNQNQHHTHHVAVLVSVQKVNPITTMVVEDNRIEQYTDTCPIHSVKFGQDRFCSKCGWKWDKQNYLSSAGTPIGSFWLDGFKTVNGEVRQYVLTLDTERGVAAQVVGDDRVYAIGIAFYLSKNPKPAPVVDHYRRRMTLGGGAVAKVGHDNLETLVYRGSSRGGTLSIPSRSLDRGFEADTFEIAAGEQIKQIIYPDPLAITDYQETPAGIICINYVSEDFALDIIRGGKVDRDGGGLGSLKGLKVGNNPF